MRRAAGLALCWMLASLAPPRYLPGQSGISLGAGVGTVRASDGTTAAAVTVSPTLRLLSRTTLADAHVTLAALPHGDWNAQLRFDTWQRLGTTRDGTGFAFAATLAGSVLPGDARAGSGQLLAELLYARAGNGIALAAGPVISAIGGEDAAAAARVRARAWLQSQRLHYVVGLEPTRWRGAWYADAYASVTLERGRLVATGSAAGRITGGGDTRATGGAFLRWRVGERMALEAGVGGFLSDPFLGFARATAASVGLRASVGRRPPRGAAPLVAVRRGDSVVVRVRVRGAATVSLAGEWAEWVAAPLRRVRSSDVWEGTVTLAPGTYRFNLVVDGTRWTLPDGVASLPDGLGGRVGLLVVPAAVRP